MKREQTGRAPSLLDATCEDFVYDLVELSPTLATRIGLEGHDQELQDFSPAYWDKMAERIRDLLADVDALNDNTDESDDEDDFDHVDSLTAAILRDRMIQELDLHHRGEDLRMLNNIDSPIQHIRDALALMPKITAEDLDNVAARLTKVPDALSGYRDSLAEAASQGDVATHRQIDAVISQCEALGGEGSMLERLGVEAESDPVACAKRAFEEMADWLSTELSPMASHDDSVGRDRYEFLSQFFLGRKVDLDETYEWALDRLREVVSQQEQLVRSMFSESTTIHAAFRKLNEEGRYALRTSDELLEWMTDSVREAYAVLQRNCFTIPAGVERLDCAIDPAASGGLSYTPPSDDLVRPGTLWWSMAEGDNILHTWHELTHIFHQGAPGHHVMHATALSQRGDLNLWRRAVYTNAAHDEGWALYAEQLMGEFGYFEEPAMKLGHLDSKRLQLARVIVDIGVHLQKKTPDKTGVWDAQYAKAFLRDNTAMPESRVSFELDRYMGWPGQAPACCVGYRAWLELREAARGRGMSLREFHDEALRLGSMPMDILAEEILGEDR
ncbi:DUF885 domain-containing protein [Corynebacterium liangguodongii]|uniref:DUF885 domain-containing protein n=1 Tax=Corynebacterium liangguodongii TaxID=2079535 RepID=A0A2S0WBJ0_9CORY|nr:DUF885 domain-containing protein [Corynebacterium liangguodongii]AWB83133.1 DUF885 domain-containing protein [Corynebacterium liangguodongii]PWB99266.1 DUF885 domain-containing protein [Corynebacterium liangguodongii]